MRYTTVITDAGETVLGWGFWTIIVAVLLVALAFAASIAVAKKAGYSGWWGAIFVLAWPIGWLFIALFAVLKWPVVKERNEALAILRENNLTLPRHDRHAVKEEKKRLAAEAEAQRNVDKAQAARVKAEAERAKLEAKSAPAPKSPADKPAVETAPSSDEGAESEKK